MENRAWWKEGIVYQIYPRSFYDSNGDGIGDLNGISAKLDYLQDLGVTILWISPFYQSPDVDMGYDISDYEAIQPRFGTMADFEHLLSEAHLRGMRIIIDLVVNHTSNQHRWFIESNGRKRGKYDDYYIWRDGRNGKAPNNWGSVFSGSAWTYSKLRGKYYLHLFAPEQPDLNWTNGQVRSDIYRMMDRWCRKGVDGFRMDVIGMISKPADLPDGPVSEGGLYGTWDGLVMNREQVHEYLREMNEKVLSKYDLMTVGETSGVSTADALKYAGSDSHELNMVFQFERVDAETENNSKWTLRRVKLPVLKEIFSRWQTDLDGKSWNSLYWENHDQPRCVSRYGDTETYWKESAKMLAVCLYMQKGTPYIYEGQELGMTNMTFSSPADLHDVEAVNAYREMTEVKHLDPAYVMKCMNRICRDNARTPFQWNGNYAAGFTTGTPWMPVNSNYTAVNAEDERRDPDSILNFYRRLNSLRKEYDVIVYGSYKLLLPDDDRLFVYTRTFKNVELLIICNFTAETVPYIVPEQFLGARMIISNYDAPASGRVRPYEGSVYAVENATVC